MIIWLYIKLRVTIKKNISLKCYLQFYFTEKNSQKYKKTLDFYTLRWISIKFDSDNTQPTLKTGFPNQIPQFQKFWTQVILSLRLMTRVFELKLHHIYPQSWVY